MPILRFSARVGERFRSLSAPRTAGSTADGLRRKRLFRFGRRQIVVAGHHLSTGLAFQFEPGAMGNPAAGLCGPFVGGQAHRSAVSSI
jgi:hypothetical protein